MRASRGRRIRKSEKGREQSAGKSKDDGFG